MENAMANNYGHKPILAPMKVFTCKYCGRKFLNSRALGGHQNAHKKERTIWMSNRKSIGLETHSLFRNPVLQQEDMNTQIGDSWRKQKLKEVADHDSCWSGCFHVYDSNSNVPGKHDITASNPGKSVQDDSNLHDLDLDLHL